MATKEKTLIILLQMPQDFPARLYAAEDLLTQIIVRSSVSGLRINRNLTVIPTEAAVRTLYPEYPPQLLGAAYGQLVGRETPLLLLEGPDAITKTSEMIGTSRVPYLCNAETLRNIWWHKTQHGHTVPAHAINGLDVGNRLNFFFNFLECSRSDVLYELQYQALIKCEKLSR